MSRRRKIALAASFMAVLGGMFVLLGLKPFEPRAEGRPVSEWFEVARTNSVERGAAFKAIASLGQRSVPFLCSQLRLREGPLGSRYASMRKKAPPFLQRLLPDPANHLDQRVLAANMLGALGPQARAAIPDLLQALAYEARTARPPHRVTVSLFGGPFYAPPHVASLARAIGRIGSADKRVIISLLEAARDSGHRLASDALVDSPPANLLAAIRAATDELLKAANDPRTSRDADDYLVRLVWNSDARSPAPPAVLLHLADSPLYHHRLPALRALAQAGGYEREAALRLVAELAASGSANPLQFTPAPDAHPYAVGAFSMEAGRTLAPLAARDATAFAILTNSIASPRQRVRAGAAFALGELGERAQSVIPLLIDLAASDMAASVRYHAAQALFKLNGDAGPLLPFKLAELNSRAPVVRKEAIEFLEKHGHGCEPAVPGLVRLAVDDENDEVRQRAAAALKTLEVDPAVVNAAVRERLGETLGRLREKAAGLFNVNVE